MSMDRIEVLDKGYVRLVDVMGDDRSVVNAARVSFAKESEELTEKDARLISYLAKHGHTSPFRHAFATFEVKAPLIVCRQWWKYIVGSDHAMDSWNESSRRYVTSDPEFWVIGAEDWRSASDDKKQGSGGPLDPFTGALFTAELVDFYDKGEQLYNRALAQGVAPEQARVFLPAYGMYVMWRWSASLQSIAFFLNQRIADDAQKEIEMYAKGVYRLVQPIFPISINELVVPNVVD